MHAAPPARLAAAILLLLSPGCAGPGTEAPPPQPPAPPPPRLVAVTAASPEALADYEKARDLLENVHLSEARAPLEEALRKDPDFCLARLAAARIEMVPAARELAFAEAERACAAATDGEKRLLAAALLDQQGSSGKALEAYRALASDFPDDLHVRLLLTGVLLERGDFDAAIREIDDAIRRDPSAAPVYNMKGYAHSAREEWDPAIAALTKYAELRPGDPNPPDSLGEIYQRAGRFEESVTAYGKAVEIAPSFYSSWIGMGNSWLFQGDAAKARECYAKAVENAPNDTGRLLARIADAVSRLRTREAGEAVRMLDSISRDALAAGLANIALDARVEAAGILMVQKKHSEAGRALAEARRIMDEGAIPATWKPHLSRRLGYHEVLLEAGKGNLAEAEKALEALDASMTEKDRGDEHAIHALRGRIALTKKDWAAAVAELEQGDPNDPIRAAWLAMAHEGAGSAEKAAALREKLARWNRPGIYWALAQMISPPAANAAGGSPGKK